MGGRRQGLLSHSLSLSHMKQVYDDVDRTGDASYCSHHEPLP